jgi:hypothetical protein
LRWESHGESFVNDAVGDFLTTSHELKNRNLLKNSVNI